MKANELRIGNLVLDKDNNVFTINGILENSVLREGAYIGIPIEWIKPIPLTEERLLKFGCEKIGVNFQKESISIWYSSYAKCYQLRYCLIGSDVERKINIEYLHQLQNLYFELSVNKNEDLI
jgi:hypothetical protein